MPTPDTERITRLELQHHQTEKRLDKGDGAFEKIKAMIDEIEERFLEKFDKIQQELAELKPIADILKNRWLLVILALSLVFTGVGLTLSFMLGVDVTTQIANIREVVK